MTVCDECGTAADAGLTPQPATGNVARRRDLLVFVLVAVAAAVITLVLLAGHRSPEVAAAAEVTPPAAAATTSPRARPASAAAATWSSEHRAQWVGNRPHSVAFELPADDTVSIWLGRVRPILVVRCVAKSTETFVFTGSAIRIEPNTEDHTVTFAFDDEAGTSQRWPDSAEHDALFAPDGAAFAQRVAHASTMRIGYTPHNATPVVAAFHVSGLAPLMDSVAKECGWP